jgi:uncharacterized membrane protein
MDGSLRQSGEPAEERMRQAKRPVSLLAGPYGHPLHPMLVTVPIGAWFASLVFDLASRVAPDPGFLARASLWLIGIGVLGALAAAMAGMLDLFAIPSRSGAQRTALQHMSLNLTVTAAYAAGFLWRWREGGHPGPVGVGMIVLSAVSMAGLACAGYLGGKLAYRYGVRVADEATQAEGYRDGYEPAPAQPAVPQPAAREPWPPNRR